MKRWSDLLAMELEQPDCEWVKYEDAKELRLSTLREVLEIVSPGKRCCDCCEQNEGGGWASQCYCHNLGDAESAGAWCAAQTTAQAIEALIKAEEMT